MLVKHFKTSVDTKWVRLNSDLLVFVAVFLRMVVNAALQILFVSENKYMVEKCSWAQNSKVFLMAKSTQSIENVWQVLFLLKKQV